MSGSQFIPRTYQPETEVNKVPSMAPERPKQAAPDRIGAMILKVEQYFVAALMFLIPVFFIPSLPASLGFDKVIISTIIAASVVILLGLSALRYTKVSTVFPQALIAFWGFVVVAFLSGLISGDIQDALRGSVFEPQTAGFFAVMALLMTIPLVLQRSKIMSLKALLFLGAGAGLIILYTLVRLVVSSEWLAFKSFGSITVSPIGGFNDLAILAALTVIVSLITLLQLPLKKAFQLTIAALVAMSLAVLSLVNFFNLWIVLGFFGLLLLVYIFSRDTLFARAEEDLNVPISPVLIAVTMLVCVVSILFVVAGDYVGARISEMTQVNYIEVRPSVTATIDIARGVYSNDILLGTGPNRFADAWRLHKDSAINETLFWNTNFNAGFGFIPTLFVTLGILGGVVILTFQGLYLYLGYRMLMRGDSTDPFWYYFGVVTFVGAVFLWGMSYVYVSGPAILLLTALFTGLSFVAYQALVPSASISIPLVSSRRRGFFLMTIVIVLITASVSTMFTLGKQYMAQAQFTKARTVATTPEEFQQMAAGAYAQYPDDVFVGAIAQTRLAQLRAMLSIEKPSEADQQKFVALASQAVAEAEQAIKLDPTNPEAHATLASVFIVLSGVGFEDAENRANGKLEDAKWRDPLNPTYAMMSAYMAVQMNDVGLAREKIGKALELKRNFSEALFLLTQLDIKEGNIESAIETTKQIVTLEPNNPTRYYQLGVLLAANKDTEGAIKAYEAAIVRDQNFANARYMLALTYLDAKRLEDALTQLKIVQETNKENEQLKNLISQLETNGIPLAPTSGLEGAVNEQQPNQEEGGDNITSPTDPNTNLVTPVNGATGEGQTPEQPAPEPQTAPAQ